MIKFAIKVIILIILALLVAMIGSEAKDNKHLSDAASLTEAMQLAKKYGISFDILNVESTSYAYVDENGDIIANDYTKSGNDFLPGFSISVYPAQIPFGSVLYIEGYGWGIAADTGDAITWGRIDVSHYSKTDSNKWGVKNVRILNFGQVFSQDQIENLKNKK